MTHYARKHWHPIKRIAQNPKKWEYLWNVSENIYEYRNRATGHHICLDPSGRAYEENLFGTRCTRVSLAVALKHALSYCISC